MNKFGFTLTQRDYQELKKLMRLKQLVGIDSIVRSPDENQQILKLSHLLQIFQFFENTESLDLICQRLQLKSLFHGQVMFDDPYDQKYLYLVLTGQVDILDRLHQKVSNTYIEKEIKVFKQGTHFWYEQLLEFKAQNLIVRGHEETHLVYLPKSLYDYLLKSSHETSVKFILNFLRELAIFKDLSSKNLTDLSENVTITKVLPNNLIIRQDDYPGYCYIVLSGQLKVIRRKGNQQTNISCEESSREYFDNALQDVTTSNKKVFDLKSNTVYKINEAKERINDEQEHYFMNVEDIKLYEVAELKRGDCFCLNSILESKIIQYSVISLVTSQLLRIDRLSLLKYEDKIYSQQSEEDYIQDDVFKNKLKENSEWEKFKKVQCEQIHKEKKYRNQHFEGLLRTNYNLNFKKHLDYVKDEQIQKRQYMHRQSLPPVVNRSFQQATKPKVF